MKRREFVTLIGAAAGIPLLAHAQGKGEKQDMVAAPSFAYLWAHSTHKKQRSSKQS